MSDSAVVGRAAERAASAGANAASMARDAKAEFDEAVAEIGEKGREAVDGIRDAGTSLAEALDEAIRTRPYTTLAVAGFIGFLYGAMRRR